MRKKKIIGIVLAAALVAGGLGGLAYAQGDSVNEVSAMFSTQWYYDVPGNAFANDEVEGHEDFFAQMQNDPDGTGADVTALTLTLDTKTEFNCFQEQNLAPEYPPYEWDFGDVAEGLGPVAWVGFRGPTQPLVPLTPGFDASRSLSETEFLQSDGTQTQTVTITLTPQADEVMTEGGWFSIGVGVHENDLVDAVITSPSSGDGHRLNIQPTGLELGKTWTIDVTIEVTPKVPKVEFMPFVDIKWFGPPSASGTTSKSWLSYTVPGVGKWTWSATGSYEWQWAYHMARKLQWHPCSREIIEHEPMTGQKLVGYGFFGGQYIEELGGTLHSHTMFVFTNPDCVSEITIDGVFILDRDGNVLYEGALLGDDGIIEPHEVQAVELHDYLAPGDLNPVTVEIFWSGVEEGLPLTGWTQTGYYMFDGDGNIVMGSVGENQMVNMEQRLGP